MDERIPEYVTVFPYGIADVHQQLLTKEAAQHMVEDIHANGFKVDGNPVHVFSVYLDESLNSPEVGRIMVEWSH